MIRAAIGAALLLATAGCANDYADRGYGIGALLAGGGRADRAERKEAARDVPFVATPAPLVDAMLDMARVGPSDYLIDLGSGDGRIPIAAARRGARALGIEIDDGLVRRATANAAEAQVGERVSFRTADLFDVRLREASVVSLYLLPAINMRLRPRLLTELRAGTRIVSHAFDMGDWTPDAQRMTDGRVAYLWIVPATAGGTWRMTMPGGRTAALEIAQRFQRVSGTIDGRAIADATLSGDRLRFTADGRSYAARVGDAVLEADPGVPGAVAGWRATRAD